MSFEIILTPLQKRILAIALAALPVCLILVILAGAIGGWSEHHARMAVLERERLTFKQLIDDLPRRTQEIAEIKNSGVRQYIFSATQVSAISGQIESDVAQAVKSVGGTMTQSNAQIVSDADSPADRISEHVAFTCDISGLVRVLHRIAEARPALFVDQLTIDDPGQGAPLAGPHRLNVNMIVTGYRRAT
jgi:hypothetical protein